MNLIEVKNLTLTYDSRTIAAENLNFQVEEGDYLCIVGQNGAGKSSLIKGLLQLIRPAGGEIVLNPSLDPRDIGYLPQQTTVQRDFPASVREVVLSGCLNRMGLRPFYSRAEKARARENMEALEILDLQDSMRHFAVDHCVSGGSCHGMSRVVCPDQRHNIHIITEDRDPLHQLLKETVIRKIPLFDGTDHPDILSGITGKTPCRLFFQTSETIPSVPVILYRIIISLRWKIAERIIRRRHFSIVHRSSKGIIAAAAPGERITAPVSS